MKLHPITGMHLEDGSGHLPDDVQAALHCDTIEACGDKARADELRGKLGIETTEQAAAREAAALKAEQDRAAEHAGLPDRVAALEARIAELEKPEPRAADAVTPRSESEQGA